MEMGGITNVTSQSTIKMDKGYYYPNVTAENIQKWSQSTIKMDKGYYGEKCLYGYPIQDIVAIHNKNGQGLLQQ